ncbi:MAG: TraR/DksA family transcriptional regulator [Desulfovibrionales bacterium]
MDVNLKERIREEIQRQIEAIKQNLSDFRERSDSVGLDQPIGRLSRMDSLTNQGILLSGIDKSKTRLARLKSALLRIDDPDFGYCRECGEEIAIKRIKAMPEAVLCVSCAEELG